MTTSLYTSCAHVYHSLKDGDLSTVLNRENGFAPRMRDACERALNEARSNDRDLDIDQDDIDALRLERDTWDLLQTIYGSRKTLLPPTPNAWELLRENRYITPRNLSDSLVHHSPVLSELFLTREWLQNTAPAPQIIESTTGYRNFTRLHILQTQRLGTGEEQPNLVKELDPDAVTRNWGKSLVPDDTTYEKALALALYSYVRAGQTEQAMELCRQVHRPWLAAALRGYHLLEWASLSNIHNLEDDAMDQDVVAEVSGNKRRKLWKTACTAAATNAKLTIADRVLNASLSPSRQTLRVLTKEACKTWEDHLWARVCVVLEEQVTQAMSRLGLNFWENGTKAFDTPIPLEIPEIEDTAFEEARRVLTKMEDVKVEEGPGADDPYHVTQLRVILNQAESLLDNFAFRIQDISPRSTEYARLMRFFAHLCIFFERIDVPISPLTSQKILEAYVTVLEEQGQIELIAQYAAALGNNAVSRYALFLAELPVSASSHERRDALFRAQEFDLDVSQVALTTADLCIERAFKALPRLSDPFPFITSDTKKLSDPERALINAIDWLTFQESTYRTASVRCNAVLRYFLAMGNLHACQEVRDRRPIPLRDDPPGDPTDRHEHLHLERFFKAWAALGLADLQGSQLLRPGVDKPSDKEMAIYETSLKVAREQVLDLLTNNWLQDELEVESDSVRASELLRVREMYVPELVIRLHRALYDSRTLIPRNLKLALLLANVVADSRYELYDAFQNPEKNRLGEYLKYVRDAILGGVEGGPNCSDPFRAIKS